MWNMVRYGQASGNDDICKAILLNHLGEPVTNDLEAFSQRFDGVVTEKRDVGRHAQVVTRLLDENIRRGESLTIVMLVKEWRSKSDATPQ